MLNDLSFYWSYGLLNYLFRIVFFLSALQLRHSSILSGAEQHFQKIAQREERKCGEHEENVSGIYEVFTDL